MIDGILLLSAQELQDKKRKLQVQLSSLLEQKNTTKDEINEIKSEILHIDKLIEKKIGSKEIKRQEEVRQRKSRKDEIAIKTYYGIKQKYRKICEITVATNRFIKAFDLLNNEYEDERVLVKL